MVPSFLSDPAGAFRHARQRQSSTIPSISVLVAYSLRRYGPTHIYYHRAPVAEVPHVALSGNVKARGCQIPEQPPSMTTTPTALLRFAVWGNGLSFGSC